jgi:hypothetical protein
VCLQVTGSLLDDDSHYTKCDPLLLTSPNSTTWEFKGVRAAIRWVGDTPSTSLTASSTTTCTRLNHNLHKAQSTCARLNHSRSCSYVVAGCLHTDRCLFIFSSPRDCQTAPGNPMTAVLLRVLRGQLSSRQLYNHIMKEMCCFVLPGCRSGTPGAVLLTPPDAVGDPDVELTGAQLANQAVLAARRAIVR